MRIAWVVAFFFFLVSSASRGGDGGSGAAAPDGIKQLSSGTWNISWTSTRAWAEERATGRKMTIYAPPPKTKRCESEYSAQILSVVGSVVSYHEQGEGDCEGAAHPYAYQAFQAVDLDQAGSGKKANPASLFEVFDKAEVETALARDTYLQQFKGDEMPCEFTLIGYETEWAVFETHGAKVAVRLGLPHGCEVMRGRLTQVGLLLTPKPGFLSKVQAADRGGHLMKQLAPHLD